MGQSSSRHSGPKKFTPREKRLLAKIHAKGLDRFARRNPDIVKDQQHCMAGYKKCTQDVLAIKTFDDMLNYGEDCYGWDTRPREAVETDHVDPNHYRKVVQQMGGVRAYVLREVARWKKEYPIEQCNEFTNEKIISRYRESKKKNPYTGQRLQKRLRI